MVKGWKKIKENSLEIKYQNKRTKRIARARLISWSPDGKTSWILLKGNNEALYKWTGYWSKKRCTKAEAKKLLLKWMEKNI